MFGRHGGGLSLENGDQNHVIETGLAPCSGSEGFDLSEDDVFRLLMQREGVQGASELIVHRDEKGRPRRTCRQY